MFAVEAGGINVWEIFSNLRTTPLQSPAANMEEDDALYPIRDHLDRLKDEWSALEKSYKSAKLEMDKGDRERNQLLAHLSRVCASSSASW
jgi:hypothetical protein